MENIIIIVILACIISYSIYYIYKAKKSGAACIGCSASKGCNGKCCCSQTETHDKKHNKKVIRFALIVIIFIVILCLGKYMKLSNGEKGGEGMFEKNSEYISLYEQDKLICNMKEDERQKLVGLLKESNWDVLEHKKRDDSYSIVLDFNNDICKLYIRKKDRTCYLKNDENQYELSDEAYTLILQYLKE